MGGDGGIQIVTIQSSPTDLLPAHLDANGKIWHVINPATLIAVDDSTDFKPVSIVAGKISLRGDSRLSGSIIRKSRFIFTKEWRTIRQKSEGRIKDSWKGGSYL